MARWPKVAWSREEWKRWSEKIALLGTEIEISPAKRVLATLAVAAVAVLLFWAFWNHYMVSPWTRDGRVRVEVVNIAAEIAGRIVQLPVIDNQFVQKGQVLFVIDPSDYQYELDQARALAESRRLQAQNSRIESERRRKMDRSAVSIEEVQRYETLAARDEASYQESIASLELAKLNMSRTTVISPVNGYVTNLHLRIGDYAVAGQVQLSVVDSDSFWIAGYFEETKLPHMRVGDPATVKLMGVGPAIRGHVESFTRGIADNNSGVNQDGLPSVNPIFTWVRLAQRIPVRIAIDHVPEGVLLAAGQTCTVVVTPGKRP